MFNLVEISQNALPLSPQDLSFTRCLPFPLLGVPGRLISCSVWIYQITARAAVAPKTSETRESATAFPDPDPYLGSS